MAAPQVPIRSQTHPDIGEAVGAVNGFFNHMGVLVSDTSYNYLHNLVKEHSALRTKYNKLENANDVNCSRFADVQKLLRDETDRSAKKDTEIDRLTAEKAELNKRLSEMANHLQTAHKRTSELEGTIQGKNTEIDTLNKTIKKEKAIVSSTKAAEKRANTELDATKADLADTKKELGIRMTRIGELDKLSSKMIRLPHDDVYDSLDSIFQSAFALVQEYFHVDFEEETLRDPGRWSSLLDHSLVKRIIPLPTTNSPAAKQMRTAAALAVISLALHQHVFQPTYLLNDGVELGKIMFGLASKDPARETYLRSVLLAILPEQQRKMVAQRVENVVRDVVACVGPLLPCHKGAAFQSALSDVCTKTCEQWARIQRLENKVESHLEPPGVQDLWFLSPLPSPDSQPAQNDQSQVSGRSSSPPTNGSKLGKSPERSPSPSPPSNLSASLAVHHGVVGIVWPNFIELQDGKSYFLQIGFGLDAKQVETARKEETPKTPVSPRHLFRHGSRKSRTLTLPIANGSKPAGNAVKPFLSSGGGNGSQGG